MFIHAKPGEMKWNSLVTGIICMESQGLSFASTEQKTAEKTVTVNNLFNDFMKSS
jgi:hypothetical protein